MCQREGGTGVRVGEILGVSEAGKNRCECCEIFAVSVGGEQG